MVYNFDRMAYKILNGLKIGDVITTTDIHEKLVRMAGFTGTRTRANFIRNLEKCGVIKDKGIGLWEIITLPKQCSISDIEEKYL